MVFLCKLLALLSLQNIVGTSLIQNGLFTQPLNSSWSHRPADSSLVPRDGSVPGNVLQIRFGDPPNGNVYDITMGQATNGSVRKGETLYFQASMRSDDSSSVGMVVEGATAPHEKISRNTYKLGGDWHKYQTAFIAPKDYAPGELQLTFYFGYGAGSAQIANVHLDDVGNTPIADLQIPIDYFSNQPNPSDWKTAADARIEKYRKGDVTIKVTSSSGSPIPNAAVTVVQQRHLFHFGTAVQASHILGTTPDDEKYRQTIVSMFNTAVFEGDMKWYSIKEPDYTATDNAIAWLRDKGFDIRAHNLVWGGWSHLPKDIKDMSTQETMDAIHTRITQAMNHFRGKVYIWDVVNEAIGQNDLWKKIGTDKIAQIYKWARETDPSVQLAYNDYDITEELSAGPDYRRKVEGLIRQIKSEGGPVDVLGMQGHIRVPLTPVNRVLGILDELDSLGVKLEVTEFDLGVKDDTVHSNYTQDYMRAMFSHPSVQGFTIWGFWEGLQWRAAEGGAIVNKDWSLRPTAQGMMYLTHKLWWTNESLTSDSSGGCSLRAFYGRQRITVTSNGSTKTVDVDVLPNGNNSFTVSLP